MPATYPACGCGFRRTAANRARTLSRATGNTASTRPASAAWACWPSLSSSWCGSLPLLMVTAGGGCGKHLVRALALLIPIAAMLPAQQSPPTATTMIGPAPVTIVPPRPNYPFPDGRSYVYSAEWHLSTGGTGVVRMEAGGKDRKVTASAESSGAVNVLFPVHDRFESRFDPRTFCSLSIFKHSEEGPHKRETSIHFDYARKKSTLDEKNLKTGETKHVENDLAGCATDVITRFYYLQSLPLQPGASYEFPISDGKTTIVRATVEERDQTKMPPGTFPAVLVTAEAPSRSPPSKTKACR